MSLYHVRIVTSDRVIHHFEPLEAADRWRRLPYASREPLSPELAQPGPRGSRRKTLLKLIAAQAGISSPELADILECSPDAINHVLRGLVANGLIAISGEADNKRRLYRITPLGRNALESSTTKDKA